MANNVVRIRAILDDKVSGGLDKINDRFKTLGTSKGFKTFTQGIGVGLGVAAFNALGSAVGGAVDFMGDAVQAAIADEASQQKLRTALTANVKAWDGNTSAIEKTLKARMALGFSDDEQRDSLATLVAATGDVTKALEVQRTAMDLARLKGISLAEASDALTKVEAGSYRILKSLGIVLKDGATAQDALNAVQKVATGQAADYAKTTGGKLLVAQTKMNESLEELGYKLLPVVSTALDIASAAMDLFGGSTDDATGDADKFNLSVIDMIPVVGQLAFALGHGGDAGKEMATAFGEVTGATKAASDDLRETNKVMGVTRTTVITLTDKVNAFESETRTASGKVVDYFGAIKQASLDTLSDMITGFFDPIETRFSILEAHRSLEADKQALRTAKSKTDIHNATNAIVADLGKQADGLEELGKQGNLTKGDVAKFKTDVIKAYSAMGTAIPPKLQAILNKLELIAGVNINIKATVRTGVQGHSAGKQNEERAKGGPVDPWEAYTVGEHGPETLVMGAAGGTIIPNGGGGSSTRIIQLVVSGRVLAEVVDEENGWAVDRASPTRGR